MVHLTTFITTVVFLLKVKDSINDLDSSGKAFPYCPHSLLVSIASRGIKSVFLVFRNDFGDRENQTFVLSKGLELAVNVRTTALLLDDYYIESLVGLQNYSSLEGLQATLATNVNAFLVRSIIHILESHTHSPVQARSIP